MKKKYNFLFLVLIIVFSLVLFGCNNKKERIDELNDVVSNNQDELSYGVSYKINKKDSKEMRKSVTNKVYELEGKIKYSDESSEYASYVRYIVPTSKLNQFLDYIDSFGDVESKTITTIDVSNSYNLMVENLNDLNAKLDLYMKYLDDDKLTFEDLEAIEKRIDELNQQIKKAKMDLNVEKDKIDYTIVEITYRIPYDSSNKDIIPKFDEYIEDLETIGLTLLAQLIYALPFIIVASIAVISVYIIKKKRLNKIDS